jgi:hypothetical protein
MSRRRRRRFAAPTPLHDERASLAACGSGCANPDSKVYYRLEALNGVTVMAGSGGRAMTLVLATTEGSCR